MDLRPRSSVRLGDGEIADAYAIGKNDMTFPLSISTVLGINFTPATVNIAHYAPFGTSQDGAFYYVMELLDGLDAESHRCLRPLAAEVQHRRPGAVSPAYSSFEDGYDCWDGDSSGGSWEQVDVDLSSYADPDGVPEAAWIVFPEG